MSDRRLAAISTTSFGRQGSEPIDLLRDAGWELRFNTHGRRLEPSESAELLAGARALIAGTERLDREVLAAAPALEVISRCGGGLDNVDLEAARERRIAVFSTPEAPVDAVAELTLAGMLDLLRHLSAADREVRDGRWTKRMGRLLAGRTVGIVGTGRVGRALAALLVPFRVRLLAADVDPDPDFARRHDAEYLPLDDLLERAEIVTLHLPLTPATRGLLDRRRLELLPAGALVVNTARGGLVDEQALAAALASGRLGGAYLDVFAEEPYRGPLAALPNALLTPHVGSYAAESRLRMEVEAARNLLLFFDRSR